MILASIFQRLQFETTQINFPLIGFWIFFVAFLLISWRVMRMPRQKVDQLSSLPLEEDQPEKSHDTNSTAQ